MKTRRPRNFPVPAAVYARAEALLGPNLERNVLNAFVVPHWLHGRDDSGTGANWPTAQSS